MAKGSAYCTRCKGSGKRCYTVPGEGVKSEPCPKCKGSGRKSAKAAERAEA